MIALGFALSAVVIPILGILAHAKLQGTLFDFPKNVSTSFALVYCYLIYGISVALPSPRTVAVAHEMAIAPNFKVSSLVTSILYFALVFVVALNRSKIVSLLGKLLTPGLLLLLLFLILKVMLGAEFPFVPSTIENPFAHGILEGYQTFDAIGSVVVGGVIVISINTAYPNLAPKEKQRLIATAAFWGGIALLMVYTGLIISGGLLSNFFDQGISRTQLLTSIGLYGLGSAGTAVLGTLVCLACFTTAVGIVTGAADFMKGRFHNSQKVYVVTALLGCVLGVLVGQLNVDYIISVALPALLLLYPVTIVIILLHLLPKKWATNRVFRYVVFTTLIFSLPDFLSGLPWGNPLAELTSWVPMVQYQLGWVLPAITAWGIAQRRN